MRRPIVIVSLLLLGAGCLTPAPIRSFEPVGRITRVTIYLPGPDKHAAARREPAKVITDVSAIRSITAFIDEERFGWGGKADMFGVPVPGLRIYLYDGPSFRGSFGAGPGSCDAEPAFFETDLAKPFASKRVSQKRCREFLALLGLAP